MSANNSINEFEMWKQLLGEGCIFWGGCFLFGDMPQSFIERREMNDTQHTGIGK
jgi:hypothetical protein